MEKYFDQARLTEALSLLHEQLLLLDDAPTTELVICGGSALIAMGLVPRTTRDLDIVALIQANQLLPSAPLPDYLLQAAKKVANILALPNDWLNNGPSSQFVMGFPLGFQERLTTVPIGEKLVVHYISRYDQIFFKTYAAADRGGYHVRDLQALSPSEEELVAAAHWCMTQDVSEEFHIILKSMFQQLGWQNVSNRI